MNKTFVEFYAGPFEYSFGFVSDATGREVADFKDYVLIPDKFANPRQRGILSVGKVVPLDKPTYRTRGYGRFKAEFGSEMADKIFDIIDEYLSSFVAEKNLSTDPEGLVAALNEEWKNH